MLKNFLDHLYKNKELHSRNVRELQAITDFPDDRTIVQLHDLKLKLAREAEERADKTIQAFVDYLDSKTG